MDRDEERRIIAQVCAGDANAFEALVVAYQKQVYNLALRTVGNEEDAADMTQEVFLRAYRALGTFRGESKFSVWLYRLTTNVCIDFLRSRRRHPTVSLTAADEDDEQPQFDIPAGEAPAPSSSLRAVSCAAPSCAGSTNCRTTRARSSSCASLTGCPMPRSARCCASSPAR